MRTEATTIAIFHVPPEQLLMIRRMPLVAARCQWEQQVHGSGRPVTGYHSSDAAIRGHVFCSFLALVLRKDLHDRCRAAGFLPEWMDVLLDLNRLQESRLEQAGKTWTVRTEATGVAPGLFKALGETVDQFLSEQQSKEGDEDVVADGGLWKMGRVASNALVVLKASSTAKRSR